MGVRITYTSGTPAHVFCDVRVPQSLVLCSVLCLCFLLQSFAHDIVRRLIYGLCLLHCHLQTFLKKGNTKGSFQKSLVQIGQMVLEKNILTIYFCDKNTLLWEKLANFFRCTASDYPFAIFKPFL